MKSRTEETRGYIRRRYVLTLIALCLLVQIQMSAQVDIRREKLPAESQVVVERGSSVGNIHVFAYADDRRIAPLGVEYDRHSWGSFLTARVDYVAEVLPVVLLSEPAKYGPDSIALTTARQLKYGFGLSPVGFVCYGGGMQPSGPISSERAGC
jgi:hypothetical protein